MPSGIFCSTQVKLTNLDKANDAGVKKETGNERNTF